VEGPTRIPDWVYTDETIYQREVEKIFHGRTWNYVALDCEIPNPGDYIRSNVGPTPVVVARADDGSINDRPLRRITPRSNRSSSAA
jgi:anthranilate 1,2-dioxygenase large subunit